MTGYTGPPGTAHELGQSVALLTGAIDQLREDRGTDPGVLELLAVVHARLRALTDELSQREREHAASA